VAESKYTQAREFEAFHFAWTGGVAYGEQHGRALLLAELGHALRLGAAGDTESCRALLRRTAHRLRGDESPEAQSIRAEAARYPGSVLRTARGTETSNCPEMRKPGGCQLPNVHCRAPECFAAPADAEGRDA
jgi:hypothetical protein